MASTYSEIKNALQQRLQQLKDAQALFDAIERAEQSVQTAKEADLRAKTAEAQVQDLSEVAGRLRSEVREIEERRDQAKVSADAELAANKELRAAEYEQFLADLNVQAERMRGEFTAEKARTDGVLIELKAEIQVLAEQRDALEAAIAGLRAKFGA